MFLDKILKIIDNTSLDPVIVLSGKDWHEGVLGIVASRIKDKFNKPVVLISIDKEYRESICKIYCWF